MIKINLKEDDNNINDDKNIININSEYIFIYNSNKIQNQDKNILNGGDYKGFRLFSKEIIGYISNQVNINNNIITYAFRDFKQIKKFNFISSKKIDVIDKGIAKKIRELDDGSFLSDRHNGIIQYIKDLIQIKKEYFKNYYKFFTNKNGVIIKFASLSKSYGNFIKLNENGIYYASRENKYFILSVLSKMAYRGRIIINGDFISITSNLILSKGENKLVEKIKIYYSFSLSENNYSIIILEKIIHKEGEIIYEQFNIFFLEEQKQFEPFKYYILFKFLKNIEFLDKIKEIANQLFSGIVLGNELLNKISQIADKDIKKINSENMLIDKSDKMQNKDNNILNGGDYKGFKPLSKQKLGQVSNQSNINNVSTKDVTNDSNQKETYNIISLIEIMGKHKKFAKKIMELNDGSFISDGYDEIIKYNKDFKQIEKEDFKNFYSFFTDKNGIIISLKDELYYHKKQNSENNNNSDIKKIYPCWNLFSLKNGNYIMCNKNGIYYVSNTLYSFSNYKNYTPILLEKAYRGGIKINDDFISITSNRILSKGENKLVFINLKSNKFEKIKIGNYSFRLSENNCSIMKIPKHENSKLLFVACKKYIKDDKNGILLIKLQFNSGDIKEVYQTFYDTENFEVYCFCQILKIDKKEMLNNNKNIETEYFLVGGFDINKRKGIIKLYQVIYYDEIEKIEIEFIQDIIMEKKDSECFKVFKGPINCIIQSSQGQILATCNDGNVYSIQPNIGKMQEIENINVLK